MKLAQLLQDVEIREVACLLTAEIQDVCYRSDQCGPGSVFVCIKGYRTDGHEYIGEALARGAVCVVVSETQPREIPHLLVENTRQALAIMARNWLGNPASRLRLVGVTGTNGKTSVTYMVRSLLEEMGCRVGLIGTNGSLLGDRQWPGERTTPESLELQRLLRQMADGGADTVVMEVSSHSLSLDRVHGCRFAAAGFTNLTRDHLDFHKTMEQYRAAKAKLFTLCDAGVFLTDDPSAEWMMKHCDGQKLTCSMEKPADLRAQALEWTPQGSRLELMYNGLSKEVWLPMPGRFSVCNALVAAGLCLALGCEFDSVCQGLERVPRVRGRLEVLPLSLPFTVVIDYAHTPDGLQQVLETVREFTKGRVITLFGCGGDRDRTKRPLMGEIAARLSDLVVLTSDNPRSESPQAILEDIRKGMGNACPCCQLADRRAAIRQALSMAQPGDVVLLAGKGHEMYQTLRDCTIPFDERAIVEEWQKGTPQRRLEKQEEAQ
ncbi:MAG: UDP-N-acetylmuramoyl-L-alanyl-D-glutamate--2,6-diaminopimelate ligase [Eubacteriales bacterium]